MRVHTRCQAGLGLQGVLLSSESTDRPKDRLRAERVAVSSGAALTAAALAARARAYVKLTSHQPIRHGSSMIR